MKEIGSSGKQRRTVQHLVVMMLMVSLSISGKQKIATAVVMKQFARWMDIFLIIKINKNILCGMHGERMSYYYYYYYHDYYYYHRYYCC